MKISIDRKSALAIYVAIITDSGRFSYENTNYKTHLVVAELLKRGISPLWVGNQLNEKKSLNEMALLTKTLGTLQMYFGGQVSVIYTSGRMLKDLGVGPEKTEGFVNYARSINTSKIAIFFLERPGKPGEVHVSFRSKGDVDVNVLASRFKGGGHPNAAGCMIRGSMDHARKAVLAKIKDFL